jgi:phosphate starvation-inducible membrane PsiE
MVELKKLDEFGADLVSVFQRLILFALAVTTAFTAFDEFVTIYDKGFATIQDLLLLFIYLEISAMVAIYFNTKRMPVRFVLYVAIAAMTRYLADVASSHGPAIDILIGSGVILTLAVSILVVKFSSRYPPGDE